MNPLLSYLEKLRFAGMTAWFAAILVAIVGFRYLKEAITYVLVKLYEFFIQHNTMNL